MSVEAEARARRLLVPGVSTAAMLVLLIGLGTWQVQRLAWKTALIADREAALSAPAVPLLATLDDAKALDFHHVFAEGRFLHDKELYIGAYSTRDVEGFQVVTPLLLADGHVLLVNRGWVPARLKDPATRPEGQMTGTVRVEGILRIPRTPTGFIVPQNRPTENFWFYVDIPGMVALAKLDDVLPFFIEGAPGQNPGGFPGGGQTRISLPNDHLQYAITWYGFAVTLLVIYFIYHYRKPEPGQAVR